MKNILIVLILLSSFSSFAGSPFIFAEGGLINASKINDNFSDITSRFEAEPRTVSCKIIKNGAPVKGNLLCDSWVGILENITAGRTGINILPGVFSGAPVCTVSARTNLMEADFDTVDPSASYIKVGTNKGTSNLDSDFYIICVGPR